MPDDAAALPCHCNGGERTDVRGRLIPGRLPGDFSFAPGRFAAWRGRRGRRICPKRMRILLPRLEVGVVLLGIPDHRQKRSECGIGGVGTPLELVDQRLRLLDMPCLVDMERKR